MSASVSAAGEGAASSLTGTVLAANIWNQTGPDAYPIASFTYLIVYKDLNTAKTDAEAKALSDFLTWSANAGQKIATELDYAPLSASVQGKVNEALKQVNFKGNPVK
jgi:ABC-type phosphate transport system substrate-binding protein